MIEVTHNLFVGSQDDEASIRGQSSWFIIHACKEPYHRQAVGYVGRKLSKDHSEYLIARRSNCLILNLVDAEDGYIPPAELIDSAISEIHNNIASRKVLVHCNKGFSRSPTIAFLYLLKYSDVFKSLDLPEALQRFREIYSPYAPARGFVDYISLSWAKYSSQS